MCEQLRINKYTSTRFVGSCLLLSEGCSKLEVSKERGQQMPRYEVKMLIEFAGEIEADSAEDAEQKAWTSWGDTMDNEITYSGVDSIEVDEVEEYDEEDEESEDE
jgi:hypothetical protein